MAFKYTGDATLGVSLTVETPKPLDTRTVVNNLTELYSIPERYAYQGMTVANVDNGNIYMLVDKSKINVKEGWKASYESILIIACTEADYNAWKANTTEDFKPVDPNKTYLHSETYYYIYEDSMDENQFYLSAEWGKGIEELLKLKASSDTVTVIRKDLDKAITDIADRYTKAESDDKFLTKTDAESTYATNLRVTDLSNLIAEDYVTKESLRGDSSQTEGDDFIFVTLAKYDEDKAAAALEINTEVLKSTKVETSNINVLNAEGNNVEVTSENNKLLVSGKQVALSEEVPKLICLPLDDYDKLTEKEEDAYYCTYGDTDIQDTGYVRSEDLARRYYTKAEVEDLIKQAISKVEAGISNITVDDANEQLIIG